MGRMIALLFALVVSVGYVSEALAQSIGPDFFARLQLGDQVEGKPGCTWQWSRSAPSGVAAWGGWYHACPAPQPEHYTAPPLQPPPQGQHVCQGINPYADPAAMMACLAALPPATPPDRQRISVGRIYDLGYPGRRVMALSVGQTVDGVEVVTYQWLVEDSGVRAPGDVDSCRNDDGRALTSCRPLSEVR